jgi:hypothetical protein
MGIAAPGDPKLAIRAPRRRPKLSLTILALGLGVASAAWTYWPATARAAQPVSEQPHLVLLFLVDRISIEEALALPELAGLAERGGVAMMTSGAIDPRAEALRSYEVVGSGSEAEDSDPALLARILSDRGVAVCGVGTGSSTGSPFRPVEVLVPGDEGNRGLPSRPVRDPACPDDPIERPAPGSPGGRRTDPGAVVAAVRAVADLARDGGGALLIVDLGDTYRADGQAPYATGEAAATNSAQAAAAAGATVAASLEATAEIPTLVVVATPGPSFAMRQVRDEVMPAIVALDPIHAVHDVPGGAALTSDSTRTDGLVASVDLAPTILTHFGIAVPAEMAGRAIEATGEPFDRNVHARYLEGQRIRFPVQIAALSCVLFVAATLILALWVVARRGHIGAPAARAAPFIGLAATTLYLCLLVGGGLWRLTYAVVVPFLVIGTAGTAWLARRVAGRRGPVEPFVFVGAVSVGFVVLDAALGGRALQTPLLGGTAFDGIRFYGLPNVFLALVLGGSLCVAHRLPPFAGFAFLCGMGLFAGFPGLGADIGGAVTLFVAAGLWWGLRSGGGLGARTWVVAAATSGIGLAIVLAANRFLGPPTHATRFVEGGGGGLLDSVAHRLSVGVHQVAAYPFVLLSLVALPVCLGLALRPPPWLRAGFTLAPRWADVLVALSVAAMVAYVVNDTGAAAAGPAIVYAIPALAVPALAAATRRGGPPTRRDDRPQEPAASGRPMG